MLHQKLESLQEINSGILGAICKRKFGIMTVKKAVGSNKGKHFVPSFQFYQYL